MIIVIIWEVEWEARLGKIGYSNLLFIENSLSDHKLIEHF